jgi:Na+/H+ antiporter NhaD/arsenite permease-like protein
LLPPPICYALFIFLPRHRSYVACGAALLLILLGVVSWREAFKLIHWNVMGLFVGMLVLADLFMQSKMPAVLAETLVDQMKTVRGAMLAVCALAGFLSIFVENVAVVLLIAPVAFAVSDKLKLNPMPFLIAIAVCTNLQGTATLIGDPPSMLLGGFMKMSFNDFFFYRFPNENWPQGEVIGALRPSIFFAVQIGAVASMLVLAWLFRRHNQPTAQVTVENVRSWTPTVMLVLLIIALSLSSFFDPGFVWLAGTLCMGFGAAGVVWYLAARWGTLKQLGKSLDWDTTFFLIGVFIVVGAIGEVKVSEQKSWLDLLANSLNEHVGTNVLVGFLTMLVLAVVVSGFVDNVPFLLAMIPVVQKMAAYDGAPLPLFMFGLLVGCSLGGNITPIGASANVVTIGLLRKRGVQVSFWDFMKIGIPFTIAAVGASAIFVWLVWR